MPENAKTPEIRFVGFTDAWEQRKLGEVTKSYSGGTPTVGKSEYYGGHIPFIRSAEINSDTTELFLTESGLQSSSAKMVNVGDILYALYGATSGEVGIAKLQGAINQAIFAINPDDGYDSQFIMQWLRGQKQKIIDKYLQGGQGNLSGSLVKDLLVKFPSGGEQAKIGATFASLDHLITLHQRGYDKTVNIKKAMLEKMFPKEGADKPEIRFAGFTDAWEQRKLGDVVEFFSGLTYSPNDVTNNGTLVLRSSNVKDGAIVDADNVYVRHEAATSDNVQVGDVIVVVRNGSRNLIGKHAQVKQSMFQTVIGAFMTGVRSKIPEFTNALLDTQQFDNETRKNLGATINQITTGMFKKMTFWVPAENEQAKLGAFFANLDNLIALHRRELEKLQNMKRALLEKMFV